MNTTHHSLLGVILAGGRATRMGGRDKAALEVGGQSLAHHAVDLLLPRCRNVVAAVGPRDSFPVPGIPILPDRVADRGPLGGLDAAFAGHPGQDILLLAVDLGLLPGQVLDDLLVAERRHLDAPAILPSADERLQPACAIYRNQLASEVAERVTAGHTLALGALADIPGAVVLPGLWSGALFSGVNTPEDLAIARRSFSQSPG